MLLLCGQVGVDAVKLSLLHRIRDAIRYAIQHGDATLAREGQGALDDIENSVNRGEPVSRH